MRPSITPGGSRARSIQLDHPPRAMSGSNPATFHASATNARQSLLHVGGMSRGEADNPHPAEFADPESDYDEDIIHNLEDVAARYLYQLEVEAGEVDNIGIPQISAIPGVPPVLSPWGGVSGLYACSQPPPPVPPAPAVPAALQRTRRDAGWTDLG